MIPLPVPYLPGAPGSGLGNVEEFAENVQRNFDKLATEALPSGLAGVFGEVTTGPTGRANTAILFCRDDGAGKSELCVQFGSGAVQVLATEP